MPFETVSRSVSGLFVLAPGKEIELRSLTSRAHSHDRYWWVTRIRYLAPLPILFFPVPDLFDSPDSEIKLITKQLYTAVDRSGVMVSYGIKIENPSRSMVLFQLESLINTELVAL